MRDRARAPASPIALNPAAKSASFSTRTRRSPPRPRPSSPGATLTSKEKLDIARNLAKLGVDIIEAGFPIASPDDLEAVRNIAKNVGNEPFPDGYVPVICGLSRANKKDIDASWEGVRHAMRPRIHTFIATSKIHMEDKLRKTPDEVVQIAVDAVKYARSLGCEDVEFSPEDAGRSDPRFCIASSPRWWRLAPPPSTSPTPWASASRRNSASSSPASRRTCPASMSSPRTARTISASPPPTRRGSRQRREAGGVHHQRHRRARGQRVAGGGGDVHLDARAGEDLRRAHRHQPVYIYPCSKMVREFSGMSVQPHKAIVGANAFAHESGIHQDGMLKNKKTYEIIAPEEIGYFRGENDVGVVMGKHSGRHALSSKLKQLGFPMEGEELDEMFKRFKLIAEQKTGGVDDDEIVALATVSQGVDEAAAASWTLEDVQVVCGTMGLPTATVKMTGPDAMSRVAACVGSGPVDAAYKAIDELVRVKVDLVEYSVTAVVEGIESLAQTRVSIRPDASANVPGAMMKANAQTGNIEARTFMARGRTRTS